MHSQRTQTIDAPTFRVQGCSVLRNSQSLLGASVSPKLLQGNLPSVCVARPPPGGHAMHCGSSSPTASSPERKSLAWRTREAPLAWAGTQDVPSWVSVPHREVSRPREGPDSARRHTARKPPPPPPRKSGRPQDFLSHRQKKVSAGPLPAAPRRLPQRLCPRCRWKQMWPLPLPHPFHGPT